MFKQLFLAHFQPVVTRFGPWKTQKCLENGALGPKKGKKWVKKAFFQK